MQHSSSVSNSVNYLEMNELIKSSKSPAMVTLDKRGSKT